MAAKRLPLPSDFSETFTIYIKWAELAGLDILDENPNVYKKRFLFIFYNLCSISLITSSALHVVKVAESYIDIIRDFLAISITMQNYITFWVMAYKSHKMKKMFFDIAELWPKYEQDDSPKTKLINKWLARYILYSKSYARFFVVSMICFLLKPLPFSIYSHFTDPEPEYKFVFNLYKPWEITSLPRYLLGLAYDSIISLVTYLCVHMSFVMILTALTYDISLLFRLVQNDLECCVESIVESNDEEEGTKNMVEIVNTHQKLLRLTQDLNDSFGLIILISYIVSVYLMCTMMFISLIIDSNNSFAVFISIAEIFSLSWPGQLIIEMSQGVATSAYKSPWYKCGKTTSRMILMIMRRSQTPAILSGMGYFDSSLATFASVMRLSWSYFNLLLQVFKE